MGDRKRINVASLGTLFDGPHATPERRSVGPYFLNIASLKSGRLDLSESDHVSIEDFKLWTRRVTPQADDLLFSYETRLGEAALMPEGVEACLGRRMALLRPDRSVVDPRFLLYYYLSPSFQRTIAENTVHGATVPRIGLSAMPKWEVELPRLPEQRAMACALGALDDKIAANDIRVSLAAELAAAVYSDIRECAVRSYRLADLVSTQYGVTTSAAEGQGPRLLRVTDINKRPWIEWSTAPACQLTPSELAKYHLKGGDILVARMADPGKAALVDDGDPTAVFASYLVRLLAHSPRHAQYIYYFLRSGEYQAYVDGAASGSVQRNMNARAIVDTIITLPSESELEKFNTRISSLRRSMRAVLRESQVLVQARNEILPLLMSGKIRVKDAEKVVEEVV